MTMRTNPMRLIPAVAFLLIAAVLLISHMHPVYGQVDTGTVAGAVADPSGAALPGVSITVRNMDTNETFHTITDDNGNYATPPLKIGRYAIRASLPGFKTAVHEGVVLRVQQRALVDLRLDLGEVSEEVVVTGEAPLLESETSALGQVIENRTIMDLPLNGRNYLQLATLTTAVVPAMAGARGEGDFNANGNRSLQNNFLMDGIDNNNRIVDLQSGSSQVITPSIDAVQEFKVQTSQYSAEFGRAAGAIINLTIKSGTNELHGTAFEFLRNDALDAKNFFAREKPKLTFNQLGATAGGPLRRDKTFLFGSWQGTRVRRGQTLAGTVPTLDMRRGVFSTTPQLHTIYDPLTTRRDASGRSVRDPFPNGIIPPNRWDAVAARMNDLWPAPNVPAQANTINVNYITHPVIRDRRDQYDARIDHLFSEKDKMFARFSLYNQGALQPGIFYPNVLDGSPNFEFSDRVDRARSLAVSQTHIFSPRTVNEFRFGWNRVRDDRLPIVKENLNEQLGLRGIPPLPGVTGLPRIVIGRVTGIGGAPFTPNFKLSQAYQFSDNLSLIRGNHSLKAGVNVLVIQSDFGVSSNARGNLTFDGRFTARDDSTNSETLGEGYADFLLGLVGGATLTSFVEGALRGRNYEFFFQDDWKATPRLTVNWGVRYDLATPLFEKNNRQANFDLSTLTLKFAKTGSLFDRALIRLDKNKVSPRLGLAYKMSDHLVLRSGYGIFVANYDSTGASGRLVANPPFFFNRNYNNNRIAPSFVLSEGFPTQGVEPAFNVQSWDEGLPLPYAQQWSLDLQYELTRNLLVEVGYTGNKGTKYQSTRDANAPLPGPGNPQTRRPLPDYVIPGTNLLLGTITRTEAYASSNYHALTLKVQQRLAHGLSFLAAYTFGKAIDLGNTTLDRGDAGIQDQNNLRAERGLTSFHVKHRFVHSYLYELPFGRGRRWLAGAPGAVNQIVSDWQLSGITTIQSGTPFTPSYISNIAGTGTYRPNRMCDGNRPRAERSIEHWYDSACFVPSPLYTFGNAGRNILFNPGLVNFDISLLKHLRVSEGLRVEFRSEFFNAFNTPHFLGEQFGGSPGFATIGGAQAGKLSVAADARVIQFGLRMIF